MHHKTKLFAIAAMVVLAGAGARPDEAASKTMPEAAHAPDRVLVKTREGAPTQAVEAINKKNNAHTKKKIQRNRLSVVELPRELSVAEAVERYEASPDVEYAEPDYKVYGEGTPNDPEYPKLYGLHNTGQSGGVADADVDAPEAWNDTTGSAQTTVAVIDTGIDVNHPDLKDNIWVNAGETPNNGIDDDKNGYVDDVRGWDFVNEDNSVFDSATDDRHGTHVAGTIAAKGNNSLGVVGMTWQAKIMPAKFIGPNNFGYTSDAIQAINYAVANGAKISNNSYGRFPYSQAMLDAIRAADARGHLYVTSAGNGAANNDATAHYPSNYDSPNILVVAATDHADALASFSSYGANSVDLAAPGVGITSTVPGNAYGISSGTSMAAPQVTGVAALMKSNAPALDDAGIKAGILESVDKKPGLSGKTVSGGRLNAAEALDAVSSPPDTLPTVTGVSPALEASDVARGANVTATFSEAMDPNTLTGTTVRLVKAGSAAPVSATVAVSPDGTALTLNPSANLAKKTWYTATIKGGAVKGRDGGALAADKVWHFITGRG